MAAFKIFRKFADLLDRSTVDLPAINTPLADALAGKATSAQGALADTAVQEGDSPSFVDVDASGTVTAGSLTTTGSVGVGTDTPESLLHVFNQATSGNISSLVIEHTGSNFGPALKVKGGLNPQILLESGAIRAKLQVSGGVAVFGTESNSKFSVFTNNTAKLTVATDGNVGIGTTSPAEKLDVVGNIKASGTVTAGSLTTYQITITGATANGILKAEAGRLAIFEGVTPIARFHASYGVMIGTQGIVGGSSATGADTMLSRVSAGTWGIGTTSKGSTDGNLSLANLTASGTVTVGGVGSDYPSVDLLGNIEPRLYLKTGTSGAKGKVGYNISNSTFGFTNYGGGAFKFFNSTSEVLTISNTGDLTASGTVTAAGVVSTGAILANNSSQIRGGASSELLWRFQVDGQGNTQLAAGKFYGWTGQANLNGVVVTDVRAQRVASGHLELKDNVGAYAKLDVSDLTATGTVKTGAYTVATLPTPSTGMRCYVTDSSVAASGNFGSTVIAAGGGTEYVVPVFYDGTHWIIA